jgi:hypothetical protein
MKPEEMVHNAPRPAPRQPKPGEEVWRLQHPDGRVQSCELRDDSRAGAGWDLMILENDEPLFSRRCADEHEARYVAQAMKQDNISGGRCLDGRPDRQDGGR